MAANVTIKAIDSSTVHQIQSGQVIVDLCSVAKELVENSIDAGATSIEVRFKNQGIDAIEVQDNGCGVSPQNYESLAAKHHTSKLSSYDDLITLQTFGFRGEALSSLSALSRLSIVTCTQEEAPRAKRLEFETSGKLKSTSVVSGQRGTTVIVEDLFRALPVRRRELERNIKREWGKVINILNQYACVQTSIKFTVSQQPTKGKRAVIFSTKGNPTTRENIINIFGVKTANALIPLNLTLELKPTAGPGKKSKDTEDDDHKTEVRVLGHVSRPSHGEGRQTPDRQMFYVNGRPCGLPQFAKVFNEVYRSYNATQTPFIFADIQLDTHLYDVNVSPDKRSILLHDQGQMLDNLREALIELFETQDVTIPVAQTQAKQPMPLKKSVGASLGTPTPARGRDSGEPEESTESSEIVEGLEESGGNDDDISDDEEPKSKLMASQTPIFVSKKSRLRQIGPKSSPAEAKTTSLLSRWLGRKSDTRPGPDLAVRNSTSGEKPKAERFPSPEEDIYGYSGDEKQKPTDSASEDPEEEPELPRKEAPIAAIPPLTQPPAPRSQHVSPIRSSKRATQEIATITIGDEMITGIIGSPAKRFTAGDVSVVRKPTASGRPATRSVPVPSFGGRLSQLFSASAAQKGNAGDLDITMEEIEEPVEEEEEEEGEDNEEEVDKEMDGIEEKEDGEDSLFVNQRKERVYRSEGEESEVEEKDHGKVEGPGSPSPSQEDTNMDEAAELPIIENTLAASAELSPHSGGDDAGEEAADDDEYVDEDEKKAREDKKVQDMIDAAEAKAPELSEDNERRSKLFLKGLTRKKESVINLQQEVNISLDTLRKRVTNWEFHLPQDTPTNTTTTDETSDLDAENAEEKLSLKISKADFAIMRIVGQFNLGFILAVRPANAVPPSPSSPSPSTTQAPSHVDDELFIIDQHASDEKYNFERLASSTTIQSQRLVTPLPLELTALEEEIILEHSNILERNGFLVSVDTTGTLPVGGRCSLLSLPLSRETTFSVKDLEELIFLIGDNPSGSATTVPRPEKVRKMLAMRACRSSIMIGRALGRRQMEGVVRHMGEMEKPWNCPHGRPTMRHLCGLGGWEGRGWKEGDGLGEEEGVDWGGWLRGRG